MTEHSRRAMAGGAVVALIGAISLFGRLSGHAALAELLPAIASMTLNTALSLLLLGIALLLPRGRLQRLRPGLAGLVILLAALTLAQLASGMNFGIDNLLYDHSGNDPDAPYPGRMAPATAVNFIFSGIALLLILRCRKRYHTTAVTVLVNLIMVVSFYCLVMGMIFAGEAITPAYPWSMSLFTAICFLVIGAALWGLCKRECRFPVARDLFYPAIRVMFKLSFPRKFFLIALVFATPLALSMQYTLSSLSNGMEQALRDRSRIGFLGEAATLLIAMQEHRGIHNVRLRGSQQLSMTQGRRGIEESIHALKHWDHPDLARQYAEDLDEIERAWASIKAGGGTGRDADLLWDAHSDVIQHLLDLMTRIGGELSYHLESDFVFHNISDAAVDHLPQIMEMVGQARGLGAGYLAEGRVGVIGNYRLSHLSNQIEAQMKKFREHLGVMQEVEPIREPVRKYLDQLGQGLAVFQNMTRRSFFGQKVFSITPDYYFLKGSQAIHTAGDLQAVMLNYLSEILAAEMERKQRQLYRIKSVAAASMLLIVLLFLVFYRSIMHMIASLTETADRMKRGDMREPELVPGDEMGDVVRSFNNIAGELVRVSANMQAIFRYAVEGIITIDMQGRICEINPAAESIFGYDRGDLAGRHVTMLMPERYRARHDAGMARHLATGDSHILGRAVELEGLRRDGSVFPIDLSVNDMWIPGGERMFIGMIRDISNRKRREEEVRRLAVVVEQAAESIVITDAEGVIQFVNPAFEALNGYTRDEVVGNTPRVLKSGRQSEEFYAELWRTIKDGGVWRSQLVNRRRDGTFYEGEHIISPIFDADGRISNFVGFQRDMTAEKALRTQMEHAQRLESLGVLAGGIAHDFNNILTAIMGNAALAGRRMDPGSPARDFLARVEDSAQSAANLCRQMLAYSGKGKFEVRPVNLSELVEEISRLMEVSIKKNVLLRYDLAPNLPAVEADKAQLQQVILNLITNANEAIEGKSGVITLNTGVMQADTSYLLSTYTNTSLPEGRYAYLEVSDTGCGMDAKTIKRIFDPFFTTKFTGRGLGMSAVVGIINSHRGALKIYSEVGRGTTFKILLPVCDREEFLTSGKPDSSSGWRGQGTVLVVDDEETIREVASMMLDEMGMQALCARDGLEALEVYRQHRGEIVCVLLDMTMPRMDGELCFSELRKINPDVLVLLSSGYTEQDAMPRFIGKGLAGFIQKPYTPEALQEKLQEALQAREVQ